jgi:hypothetical protein
MKIQTLSLTATAGAPEFRWLATDRLVPSSAGGGSTAGHFGMHMLGPHMLKPQANVAAVQAQQRARGRSLGASPSSLSRSRAGGGRCPRGTLRRHASAGPDASAGAHARGAVGRAQWSPASEAYDRRTYIAHVLPATPYDT